MVEDDVMQLAFGSLLVVAIALVVLIHSIVRFIRSNLPSKYAALGCPRVGSDFAELILLWRWLYSHDAVASLDKLRVIALWAVRVVAPIYVLTFAAAVWMSLG